MQKWTRHAEMDQTYRNGSDMQKWTRCAEMGQTCRDGSDMQKWTRHAEMDQTCRNGSDMLRCSPNNVTLGLPVEGSDREILIELV